MIHSGLTRIAIAVYFSMFIRRIFVDIIPFKRQSFRCMVAQCVVVTWINVELALRSKFSIRFPFRLARKPAQRFTLSKSSTHLWSGRSVFKLLTNAPALPDRCGRKSILHLWSVLSVTYTSEQVAFYDQKSHLLCYPRWILTASESFCLSHTYCLLYLPCHYHS